MTDDDLMRLAIEMARQGGRDGEVPVGAVAFRDGAVIAAAHNSPISRCDPTAHAEILALRAAAAYLGAYRLEGVGLAVTLEPCIMCFGAMLHARIGRLVYGAPDPKVGFSHLYGQHLKEEQLNHTIEIRGGVMSEECAALLREFFRERR